MIKVGTNVKSKIHDDLTGSVVLLDRSNDYAVIMTTIAELKKHLSKFNDDEKITFYFLKNNCLTNCQLEDINSYGMGIEFTIQDTYEDIETQMW